MFILNLEKIARHCELLTAKQSRKKASKFFENLRYSFYNCHRVGQATLLR